MSKRGIITQAMADIPDENRQFVKKSLDIQDHVAALLAKKGWSQKDLATRMGKTEAEVSRWLNELHNLTIKSIAKLETALGADIIVIPAQTAATSVRARSGVRRRVGARATVAKK